MDCRVGGWVGRMGGCRTMEVGVEEIEVGLLEEPKVDNESKG